METNEINPKPQSTGGLKLMTVFIAVLALHVVVIGGFTVYHLMSGGSTDTDLAVDKVHKGVKVTPDNATVSDGQLPDGMSPDKNATAENKPAEGSEPASPMTIPAPAAGKENIAEAGTPPPAAPAPATPAPSASATASAAPAPSASAPSGPMAGPVISPPPGSVPPAGDNANSAAADTAASGSGESYAVKKGDSLARIAHQHHIKVAALRSANGLKSDFLHIGQKLTIPAATPAANAPAASATAIASAPAREKKEKVKGLAKLRQPNTTLLGDSIPDEKISSHEKASVASSGGHHTYTVAKGDTLTRIAHRFHTSSSAIMALNNISDARKLRLGQKLRIPSQESRSATATSPSANAPIAPRAQPADRIEPRATPTAQLANFVP